MNHATLDPQMTQDEMIEVLIDLMREKAQEEADERRIMEERNSRRAAYENWLASGKHEDAVLEGVILEPGDWDYNL